MIFSKEQKKQRDKMIRQMYGKIPANELARRLGIKTCSLYNYVSKNKMNYAKITFSKEKKNYIQAHYGVQSLRNIAQAVGTTVPILKVYIAQNNIVSTARVMQSLSIEKAKFDRKSGCYEHLCWSCRLATNPRREILESEGIKYAKCPWSSSFRPVKGWKAESKIINLCGKDVNTYKVFECPKYIEEAWNCDLSTPVQIAELQ